MQRLSALPAAAFLVVSSAFSQTVMTIGTGVDPSLARFYVAKEAT